MSCVNSVINSQMSALCPYWPNARSLSKDVTYYCIALFVLKFMENLNVYQLVDTFFFLNRFSL